MQGYGQQQMSPEQYGQALQAFNVLKQRQDTQQQMNASGNPYAMLGAALSGLVANKFGKYKDTSLTDAGSQLDQYQAQQEAKLARIAEEKALREAAKKRAEKLADTKAQNEFDMRKMMTGKQFDVDNRAPSQGNKPAFNERLFNQLNPEQKASYMNKFAGIEQQGGGQLYSKEEQALIQQNPELEAKIKQQKINEATGVKPISETTRQKVGFLKNAREKLEKYKQGAFEFAKDENGNQTMTDYKELGSKFGNTNNLLVEAVRNKLRAESGAAISDKEAESEAALFMPSSFRSDETNYAKIQELEETLNMFEKELAGQQPQQSEGQSSNQPPVLNAANEILKKRGLL